MGTLIKAAKLSFKISVAVILALWLLLAMGIELAASGFFHWTGYLALFFFVGYNCFLWYWGEEKEEVNQAHA